MGASDVKGICRNVLGGDEGTLLEVFENLRRTDSGFERHDDPFWNATHWTVPLPEDEGGGGWRLMDIGGALYAIVTECEYFTPRAGLVPAEGLIGLHFILDGPVELTGMGQAAKALPPVTMLASHQSPGVSFAVSQPAGLSRMLTICITPEMLLSSFGLNPRSSRAARRLLEPATGTVSIVETVMPESCTNLLEDLFRSGRNQPGSLAASTGLLIRIIGQAVEILSKDAEETSAGSYSLRELRLLESTRQALGEALGQDLSLAEIARRLGTNQTKLKSGLRAVYGITASGYRRQCRMVRAMQLLTEQHLPASVVAGMVGYSAHASFTVAFTSYYGINPREARLLRSAAGQRTRPASP
jgi:AraC-like DNA-binding protein